MSPIVFKPRKLYLNITLFSVCAVALLFATIPIGGWLVFAGLSVFILAVFFMILVSDLAWRINYEINDKGVVLRNLRGKVVIPFDEIHEVLVLPGAEAQKFLEETQTVVLDKISKKDVEGSKAVKEVLGVILDYASGKMSIRKNKRESSIPFAIGIHEEQVLISRKTNLAFMISPAEPQKFYQELVNASNLSSGLER